MIVITAYKTRDKKIFDDEQDALNHENYLDAVQYLEGGGYYGMAGSTSCKDILDFILEHRDMVLKILKVKLPEG